MKSYDLTDAQKQEALKTGKCPDCGNAMKALNAEKSGKHELYCEPCHLSVPAWKGA